VVVLIPGTGVIYTVSTGLFVGWRASIAAAIGCTAGIIPHLTASVAGLSAVLHMSALAFQVLKYAGSIYLVYLFILYGLLASGVSTYFTKSHKLTIRLRRTFAVIFAALAVKLAMSEQ
jgi:threonine/homoserine/homoserine lactone efflux protein